MRFASARTAALLAAAALVAGCTGDGSSAGPVHVGPRAEAPEAAGATGPDGSVTADSPAAEQGDTRRVDVPGHPLSFSVPESWFELDVQEVFRKGEGAPDLDELAGRLGVPPDELSAGLSEAIQLMVFSGDGAQGGFLDNINVIVVPLSELPTNGQVRLELGAVAAKDVEIERIIAPEGRRIRISYRLPMGGRVVAGRALFVDLGDQVAQVTVSALEDGEAERVMRLVAGTAEVSSDGPGA